jgi:hypothetical protein
MEHSPLGCGNNCKIQGHLLDLILDCQNPETFKFGLPDSFLKMKFLFMQQRVQVEEKCISLPEDMVTHSLVKSHQISPFYRLL